VARHKEQFLEEFVKRGIVRDAARAAGIHRTTVYMWLNRDAAFAGAFRDAEQEVSDLLEEESHKRAMGEVRVPVYHQGEVVGYMPRYSDGLLMFLLRARRPEVYRERCERRAGHSDSSPMDPLAAVRGILDGL
jgi:hypothetical protein